MGTVNEICHAAIAETDVSCLDAVLIPEVLILS